MTLSLTASSSSSARVVLTASLVALALAGDAQAGGAKTFKTREGRSFTETRVLRAGARTIVREVRDDATGELAIGKTRVLQYGREAGHVPGAVAGGEHRMLTSVQHRRTIRGVPRSLGVAYDWQEATLITTRARGASLADLVADGRRPTARQAARVIAKAARVVDKVHRGSQVANLDLKPEHIFVADVDAARPDVTIVDWDQAGEIDSHWNVTSATAAFAAPEMWSGDRRHASTDVFALGASLRMMITGEAPLDGAALRTAVARDAESARKIRFVGRQRYADGRLANDPRAVVAAYPVDALAREYDRQLARGYDAPAGLKAIVDKAMAREPAARYPTARAFADALRRWESTQR